MSVPEHIAIRRAEPRDIPALGRLGAALMRAHHAFDERRFMSPGADPEAGYAWFLGTQMESRSTLVLVAEQTLPGQPAEVVGYVYAAIEPQSWKELRDQAGFIHDLLVADGARGSGVGPRLIDEAVAWLRAQGMPRVLLWAATANTTARRIFEARGFRSTMVEMTLELSGD